MAKLLSKIPVLGKYLKARELSQKTIKEYFEKKEALELAQEETQTALELFGRVKIEVLQRTLRPFVAQLSRIEDIELIEEQPSAEHTSKSNSVTQLDSLDIERDHGLAKTVAAGGIGATSAAIAYGAVGAFASASTGTAITALSGAAASNATLAFLGGGTLAAGGTGVVGGAVVLGGLVTVPLLVVGGLFFNKRIRKELENAEQDAEKVRLFIEESNRATSELFKIRRAATQLHRILIPIESNFVPNINHLIEIIDRSSRGNIFVQSYYALKKFIAKKLVAIGVTPPEWMKKEAKIRVADFSLNDQQKVEEIIASAQMLKNILDINIINDEGIVPAETFHFISTVEEYLHKTAQPA
ncbi:MAG: hypothetical protein NTV54_00155 [Ignavibacteriales bacterium]|nr:hypothetical protein [Ignavibacteriales bacterium]